MDKIGMDMQEKSFVLPFPPTEHQAWLDKVSSDMKGNKSWQDFITETEGISLNPFDTTETGDLPLDRLFDETMAGARLRIDQAKSGNQQILAFLEKGADALFAEIRADMSPEELCSGIHLDFIFSVFQVENKETASRFASYLESVYEDKSIQSFVVSGNEVIYPKETIYLPIDISQGVTNAMATALKQAEKVILSKKPLRCLADFSLGKDFLLTISALRAFRILWENLLVNIGFEEDIPLIVMSSPKFDLLSENPNQALIESSYCILSAILGNVDISLSTHFPKEGNAYDVRAFLIHQIYKEEGKLFSVKDPAAGSYYIEQATRKLATKSWESL